MGHVGRHEEWIEDTHQDVVRVTLLGQTLAKVCDVRLQREDCQCHSMPRLYLRSGIGGEKCGRQQGGHGGDVDEETSSLEDHLGQDQFGHAGCASDVHVDQRLVEVGLRSVSEGFQELGCNAYVVHQNENVILLHVEEGLDSAVDVRAGKVDSQSSDLNRIHSIGAEKIKDVLFGLFQLFLTSTDQHEVVAFTGQV